MPRSARIDLPGLLQHVIVRGIEKRDIFNDDSDRLSFLTRFSELLQQTHTDCFAWSLMTTHFHLLLRPRQDKLARFMRRLLTGYATTFNLRHNRSGHLFQNRYKSIVCEEEPYFLELVRYIHLNPLRGGILSNLADLDRYPWCGHSVLLGNRKLPGQDIEYVLSRFGTRSSGAYRMYRDFIADGIKNGIREDLSGGGKQRSLCVALKEETDEAFDPRILGSGAFVEKMCEEVGLPGLDEGRLPLEDLMQQVAEAFGVFPGALAERKRSRIFVDARSVFCYLAVRKYGYNGEEVGKCLNISRSGVSVAARRGEFLMEVNHEIPIR